MQRMRANSSKAYKVCAWLVPLMPLVIAAITWLNGLSGHEVWLEKHTFVIKLLDGFKANSPYFYVASWVIWIAAVCYKKMGDPWVVEQLQLILDRYQEEVFDLSQAETPVPKDYNRVTLFRCQRNYRVAHWTATHWYKPWGEHSFNSKFLVPVLRSGHISKKSNAVFHVSDNSAKTEGIAGRAWSSDAVVFEQNLPEASGLKSKREKTEYAEKTGCNFEMVESRLKRGKSMPRAMLGIPVHRFGKVWGVIVIDSKYPDGIKSDAPARYKMTLAIIERLLEKAR